MRSFDTETAEVMRPIVHHRNTRWLILPQRRNPGHRPHGIVGEPCYPTAVARRVPSQGDDIVPEQSPRRFRIERLAKLSRADQVAGDQRHGLALLSSARDIRPQRRLASPTEPKPGRVLLPTWDAHFHGSISAGAGVFSIRVTRVRDGIRTRGPPGPQLDRSTSRWLRYAWLRDVRRCEFAQIALV